VLEVTPRILIIAGSDSGGGAGIQADIKTVTMLGGHAMTAITALTAQNTLGVTGVMPVPAAFVIRQMDAVISDLGVDAVKIGMIGSPETAHAVADRLEHLAVPIVFDPVMVATSGSVLADDATVAAFGRLMRIATVVTPNIPELEILTAMEIATDEDRIDAASVLAERFGCAVLAKGGHTSGDEVVDALVTPEGVYNHFSERLSTNATHGTGCTLATAVATGLGGHLNLDVAVSRGIDFVQAALRAAPGLGKGNGPLGHSLGTIPFHHWKAANSGEGWRAQDYDSLWAPTGRKH
jgi:hydroxymethylpyrimidine/phosphomethylpyrimidine kinase